VGLFSEPTYDIKRRVFAFRPRSARIMIGAENPNRICHLPGMGGVAVLRDSHYVYRDGHIFWPTKDEARANLQRSVRLTLWVRQDDPTPISLAAGRAKKYQGARLTKEDQDRLDSNMARTTVADHKRLGTQRDMLTRILMITLFMLAMLAGLIWLSIPVIGLVRG